MATQKKFLDQDGLAIVVGKLNTKFEGKVDKEAGMGLSSNDFTDEDKAKLQAFQSAENYMQKSDMGVYALKSDISNAYIYRGSVANFDALPAGAANGDVYNTEDSGMNYAWNGSDWDALGETFSVDSITSSEIDALFA